MGKHRPLQVFLADNSEALPPYSCLHLAFWGWPHVMNNAYTSLLLLKQDYLGQTSASHFLSEDRWEKFPPPPPPNSLSKTALGKHNYSWKHFRVTRLSGGMKVSQCFSFFFLIWAVFNLHFPRAWLNPQMKLTKLSSDYVALTACLTKKQCWERRQRGDETQARTLGVWAELGYTSAEGLCTLHHSLLYFLPNRLEFALKLYQNFWSIASPPQLPGYPAPAVHLIIGLLGSVTWKCRLINQF